MVSPGNDERRPARSGGELLSSGTGTLPGNRVHERSLDPFTCGDFTPGNEGYKARKSTVSSGYRLAQSRSSNTAPGPAGGRADLS
eukprot:3485873-Prymnesium_polylepis.1